MNPFDWTVRDGYLKESIPFALPLIPGWDLSGVVEAVGPGVGSWKAGEAVHAMAEAGKAHELNHAGHALGKFVLETI